MRAEGRRAGTRWAQALQGTGARRAPGVGLPPQGEYLGQMCPVQKGMRMGGRPGRGGTGGPGIVGYRHVGPFLHPRDGCFKCGRSAGLQGCG